jgi:hypothetical protein
MLIDPIGVVETEATGFAFSIPYYTGTRKIQLTDNGNVLTEREVTPNPPTVWVTYPNGGEILGGLATHTITWQGSDPDGDNLSYAVMYSSDGGVSWQPLALDLRDTKYFWNTSNLSTGDNYLIRVIASDGVNTGMDDSDSTFTILAGWTQAIIDFDPDTLNLKDNGKWVTVYIELQENHNISEIEVRSVVLNDNIPALTKPIQIGDYDNDAIPDLMIKFNREAIHNLFKSMPVPGRYMIKVTGIVSEIPFIGTAIIRVISPP